MAPQISRAYSYTAQTPSLFPPLRSTRPHPRSFLIADCSRSKHHLDRNDRVGQASRGFLANASCSTAGQYRASKTRTAICILTTASKVIATSTRVASTDSVAGSVSEATTTYGVDAVRVILIGSGWIASAPVAAIKEGRRGARCGCCLSDRSGWPYCSRWPYRSRACGLQTCTDCRHEGASVSKKTAQLRRCGMLRFGRSRASGGCGLCKGCRGVLSASFVGDSHGRSYAGHNWYRVFRRAVRLDCC